MPTKPVRVPKIFQSIVRYKESKIIRFEIEWTKRIHSKDIIISRSEIRRAETWYHTNFI